MHPRVSVVIPIGPDRSYLPQTLVSIAEQTFTDFEVLMDDEPGGQGAYVRAMNRMCHKAQGEYIAVQDADDLSYPMRLEREVEFLDRYPEVAMVGTWGDRIGSKSGVCSPPANVSLAHLFLWSRVLHTSAMMRREEVLPFGPYRQVIGEDWDLWIRLVKAGKIIRNIPEPLVAFRFHDGNRTKAHARALLLAAHIKERLLCLRN